MPKGIPLAKVVPGQEATTIRRCYQCKEEKPLTEFYPKLSSVSGYRYECKKCSYMLRRAHLLKNPDYKAYCRNNNLKRKFKMGTKEYESLLAKQSGRCKICSSTKNFSKHDVFHVDHDHKTGKVRGLLCNNCNLALGNFQDSTVILKAAIEYLECNSPKNTQPEVS